MAIVTRRRTYQGWREILDVDVQMDVSWTVEGPHVRSFSVVLIVTEGNVDKTVRLYDCSHADRNDMHRYTFEGVKEPPENFHYGTPAEAMRLAMDLIRGGYREMIESWRP